MQHFKIVLDTRTIKKNGKFPLKLRVTDNKLVRFIALGTEYTEKEFDKMLPKYSDRPKKYNPLSASHGLESYYPNEMIMPPIKDPLQKSSIEVHPDSNTLYYC